MFSFANKYGVICLMDIKLEKMIQELLARIDTLERENARLQAENDWVPRRSEKILEHPSCQNRFRLPRRFNVLGGTAPSPADFAESCAFQLRHLTPVCLYGVII